MKRVAVLIVFTFAATPAAAGDYQLWVAKKADPWAKWQSAGRFAATVTAGNVADAYRGEGYVALVLPVGEDPNGKQPTPAPPPSPPHNDPDPKNMPVPVTPTMLDDIVTALRKVDARVADVQGTLGSIKTDVANMNTRLTAAEKNVDNLSAQLTRLDSRLSAVEKGSPLPWQSGGVLTDPLAAQTAGRQAGQYDQFGRFVQNPVVQGMAGGTVPLVTFPSTPVYVAPAYQATYNTGYSAGSVPFVQRGPIRRFFFGGRLGAGGCSGGS